MPLEESIVVLLSKMLIAGKSIILEFGLKHPVARPKILRFYLVCRENKATMEISMFLRTLLTNLV
jgi:hypothetical protein